MPFPVAAKAAGALMSDTNAAAPAAPAAPNNRKKIAIGFIAILSALVIVGSSVAAGVVWWNLGEEEDVATATPPAPVVTPAKPTVVTPATSAATPPAPVAAEPSFTEKLTKWWSAGNEPTPTTAKVVKKPAPVTATQPAPAVVTPTTVASAGFAAHGTSFPAPDESGMDAPTAEVMLGEVADSARSASGRTEVYWVQGTHEDALTGARVDRNGKVVDPDDIRRLVGVNTTWTAIPDNANVVAKCVVIHANDDDNPGSCLPVQTASR